MPARFPKATLSYPCPVAAFLPTPLLLPYPIAYTPRSPVESLLGGVASGVNGLLGAVQGALGGADGERRESPAARLTLRHDYEVGRGGKQTTSNVCGTVW